MVHSLTSRNDGRTEGSTEGSTEGHTGSTEGSTEGHTGSTKDELALFVAPDFGSLCCKISVFLPT